MRPEVMEAINYVSQYFVEVEELHDAVGKRIAHWSLRGRQVTAARLPR